MAGDSLRAEVDGSVRAVADGMLIAILLVAAFVLFVLAALNVPSTRVNLGWAGAACLTLAWLIVNWPK